GNTGEDADKAKRELQEIQVVLGLEKSAKGTSYFHMLFGIGDEKLHVGRRVQLVIWLPIFQYWSGIAGITMFAPTIFRIAGFDSHKAQWIAGLNNIFYTFSTLICVFTLDKIGRRWTLCSLTLALPYIVSAINEKTLYVFGACNVLSIPIVWALYPESSQRTLEEMDLLFAADSPWVWAAEKNFKLLKAQGPDIASHDGLRDQSKYDKV
ncbi:hypothetical protein V1517DRAFT_342241, partial [Lipomyces orientalis]